MHEISIAMSLVEEADKIARRERAVRVRRVFVSVGELSGVEVDPLQFSFPLVAQGTTVEGGELVIEKIPITILCNICGKETAPGVLDLRCPSCSSADTSLTKGRELLLNSVELERNE